MAEPLIDGNRIHFPAIEAAGRVRDFRLPSLGGHAILSVPWFGSSVICSVLENHQSAYRVSQPAGDRKIALVNGKIGQLDDRLH